MPTSDVNQRVATLGLRERRRIETSAEIAEAALNLFEANGVESTTVADIALAAGISARTFFRYFPNKEAAVLGVQVQFDEAIAELLERVSPERSILSQIEDAYSSILENFDDRSGSVRTHLIRLRNLMTVSASIRNAVQQLNEDSNEDLAQKIAARVSLQGGLDEARTVVFVAGFVVSQAFECWVREIPDNPVASLPDAYERSKLMIRRILN